MCSYCGCDSIDVVGRFMREHVEIVNAAGDLRRACEAGDRALSRRAVDALAALLHPHTRAEEAGLFAVLAEDVEFAEHVHRLCDEHDVLDGMLERLGDGEHGLFPTFERALRDHIQREEDGLFPAAAVAFAGPEWERVTALTPEAPAVPA